MTTGMFRDRLAQAMRDAGLSQAQLARTVKVSRATVSQWCSGAIEALSADRIFPVARACGVDPEWLALGTLERRNAKNMASAYPPRSDEDALQAAIAKLPDDAKLHLTALIESLVMERHASSHTHLERPAGQRHAKRQ